MPTTFDVFFLGYIATDLDPTEGNTTSENAAALVGSSFGTTGDPVFNNIQTLAPGSTGFSGGNTTKYDTNNSSSNDTFKIDGGPDQIFDSEQGYTVTLTYADGSTVTSFAAVMQDTAGNLYLIPGTSQDANQEALEAKPILSITIDSFGNSYNGMTADRIDGDYAAPDGTIDGTTGHDTIEAGYFDADGDAVDGFDGDVDIIDAGIGNDVINAGAGNDTIYGGAGRDSLLGGSGNDSLDGGADSDSLDGGAGDDYLFGGDARDYLFLSAGNDTIVGGTNLADYDALDTTYATSSLTVTWTSGSAGTVQMGGDTTTFSNIGFINASDLAGTANSSIWGTSDYYDASASTGSIQIQDYMGGADTILGSDFGDLIDVFGWAGLSTDGTNISAGGGDDYIGIEDGDAVANSSATIDGGTGNDYIYFTSGDGSADVSGGSGNDTIYGSEGAMTIRGGTGDDLIDASDKDGLIIM